MEQKGLFMKSSLWVVNNVLAFFLFLLFICMAIMRKPIVKRTSIIPLEVTHPFEHETSKINPIRIYESDLFKTFVKAQPEPVEETEQPVVLPMPPQPKSFTKKPRSTPEFLAPLDVELKGIIYNSNNANSRAIIMNRKTKMEQLHKIGDVVEDAHLIFVGKNKAMFIRSNGQQETLFVSAEAAQKDSLYAPPLVSGAVERIDEYHYIVSINQFVKEVHNLAQFLDNLDITTAFDQGRVLGCRIGKLTPKSIGSALGLQYGDIITSIDNISAITTADRVKIFKNIEKAVNNQQVVATILRSGHAITLTYTLHAEIPKKEIPEAYRMLPAGTPLSAQAQHVMRSNKQAAQVTEQTLQQAQTNNAVADIFKKNDKKTMLEYGGRNTLLQR